MNYKPLVLILCILVCTYLSGYAQKMIPGYFVNSSGDTIKGQLEYPSLTRSPSSLRFFNGTDSQLLTPGNTTSLHWENNQGYIGYTGFRMINPPRLLSGNDTIDVANIRRPISAFLRVLYSHNHVGLMEYEDNFRVNYFLRLRDTIFELIHIDHLNDNFPEFYRNYQKQLLIAFQPVIFEKQLLTELNKTDYTDEDLVKIIEKINGRSSLKFKKKYPTKLLVEAGASLSFFGSGTVTRSPEINADYNTSIAPVASIAVVLYNQRKSGKWFIQPQVKITSFKNEGPSRTPSGSNLNVTYQSGIIVNPILNGGLNLVNQEKLKFSFMLGTGIVYSTNLKIIGRSVGTSNEEIVYATPLPLKFHWVAQTRLLKKDRFSLSSSFSLFPKPKDLAANHFNIQVFAGIAF